MLPQQSFDGSYLMDVPTQDTALPPDLDPRLTGPATKLMQRYIAVRQNLAEAADIELEAGGRHHYSNHLAEDASDASEWQSRAAMTHHLSDEMRQIQRAYALLRAGRYGVCEHCGHTIPPRRMDILPSATLCVGCQEHAEQRH